jgi:bifunctional non-homologous end joining protein LigD
MVTSDGRWRVEAVRRGRSYLYRVECDGSSVADGLALGSVTRLLREAGVELADLRPDGEDEDPSSTE